MMFNGFVVILSVTLVSPKVYLVVRKNVKPNH